MTREGRLGTEKISKLMVRLAIPAIVAQLINVLYNMVDRMYIGRLQGEGALALTGLGICFPIIIIITSFSMFVGAGGAPLAAIALGKQDKEEAEKILGNGVTILMIFSIVLPVVFFVLREPMLYMFGATENTIGYAMDYISIYLLGTVFVQVSMGLNQFISSQGQAKIAMLSVVIGAVINIILDPIFIFGLGMGVKGAAIATITSQAVSAIWVFRFLRSEKSAIRIKKKMLKLDRHIVGMIAALGMSPFLVRITESLIEIVFNNTLKRYGGDIYVGAMTVCLSVLQMVFVVIQGYTIGVQPIVSYNYGAKKFDRVRKACKDMITVTFIASSLACLVVILFPGAFARIYTNEAALIELVKKTLPMFFAGVWILGLQMSIQTILLGLKQAKASIFLAMLRKIILLIPLTLLLPRFFGVMGIYWAESISDIISALASVLLFVNLYRKFNREEERSLAGSALAEEGAIMPKKAFVSIPESKRQRVMDCALVEFSQYEYHDASINRIVKCAEIPRGSFYQYFEDKEDLFFHLFEAILESELEKFFKQRAEAMPKDPVLFHQIIFTFNLHMLNSDRYRDFFRNFFLVMDYRFTCRYKEIVSRQRDIAIANSGLNGSDTGKRIKEMLEICSLITMELLAVRALNELSDEDVWDRYHTRFQILGWNSAKRPT